MARIDRNGILKETEKLFLINQSTAERNHNLLACCFAKKKCYARKLAGGEIKQDNRKHFVKKKRKAANCEYEFIYVA